MIALDCKVDRNLKDVEPVSDSRPSSKSNHDLFVFAYLIQELSIITFPQVLLFCSQSFIYAS